MVIRVLRPEPSRVRGHRVLQSVPPTSESVCAWALQQKRHRNHGHLFLTSGGWEVQGKSIAGSGSGEDSLLGQRCHPPLCPPVAGPRGLRGLTGPAPTHEVSPSGPNHLPKASPPNITVLEVRFTPALFGGYIPSMAAVDRQRQAGQSYPRGRGLCCRRGT